MRVSFAQLKQKVSLLTVAKSYGVTLRQSGSEYIGPCPLHKGDNPTAFHLNTHKNRWRCFTHCGYGDVIDFVARINRCSLLDAATQLANNYAPELLHEIHPFFTTRGFDTTTLKRFEIKYSNEQRWRGMITIPLHDHEGTYLGIMGRRLQNLEKGKYCIQRGLKRSHVLFNYHRIDPSRPIFVTEGPFDVLRLFQAGYANAIALLGVQLSTFQLSLLANRTIVLLLDQDEAGQGGTKHILKQLKNSISLKLPGKDPADLSPSVLRDFLTAQGFNE